MTFSAGPHMRRHAEDATVAFAERVVVVADTVLRKAVGGGAGCAGPQLVRALVVADMHFQQLGIYRCQADVGPALEAVHRSTIAVQRRRPLDSAVEVGEPEAGNGSSLASLSPSSVVDKVTTTVSDVTERSVADVGSAIAGFFGEPNSIVRSCFALSRALELELRRRAHISARASFIANLRYVAGMRDPSLRRRLLCGRTRERPSEASGAQ